MHISDAKCCRLVEGVEAISLLVSYVGCIWAHGAKGEHLDVDYFEASLPSQREKIFIARINTTRINEAAHANSFCTS